MCWRWPATALRENRYASTRAGSVRHERLLGRPALIEHTSTVERILRHLGLPTDLPEPRNGKTDKEIGETVGAFVTAGDEGTHGSPIFYDRAQKDGLKIEYVDKASEVWRIVREVFVRLETYVGSKGIAKYVLCRNGGIDLRVEVRQP